MEVAPTRLPSAGPVTAAEGSESIYGNGTGYQLELTQPTAPFNGFLFGQVSPAVSLARVTTTGGGSALTLPNGYFFMPHISGSFTLTVSATGYEPYSTSVSVAELAITTVNISLISNSKPTLGNVDNDDNVDLADAILALQVMTRRNPSQTITKNADVSGDGKIGLAEIIYILQTVAGIRGN